MKENLMDHLLNNIEYFGAVKQSIQKQIKREGRKVSRQIKSKRNFVSTASLASLESEKNECTLVSRYLHLLRAFVGNRHYRSTENSTRPGNEVCPAMMSEVASQYGLKVSEKTLNTWLSQ